MYMGAPNSYSKNIVLPKLLRYPALRPTTGSRPLRILADADADNLRNLQQTRMAAFSSTAIASQADSQKRNINGDPANQKSYVLTLRTSNRHHKSMDDLRQTYFPPTLNKVAAHITLFHALPGSKLDKEILPAIADVVAITSPYRIRASHPFRMARGIGIHVDDDIDHAKGTKQGRNMTRQIHAAFRKKWADWLSDQDSSPIKMHYTVMNKIDDEAVIEKAMELLKQSFDKGEDESGGNFHQRSKRGADESKRTQGELHNKLKLEGDVQGLTLWTYHHSGHWKDPEHFWFEGKG